MNGVLERLNNKINNFFGSNIDSESIKKLIVDSDYLDTIFKIKENVTLKSIIKFIDEYEENIINGSFFDDELEDELLREGDVVYRTNKSKITRDYFKRLISNIRNNEFNHESMVFLLSIVNFVNLYGLDYPKDKIKTILDNGIYSIVKNVSLASDGDKNLSDEEKLEKTDILLSWQRRCGNAIINNIFNLEVLQQRLMDIYNSNYPELQEYKPVVEELIMRSILAVNVRNNESIIPTEEEINKINNLFEDYKKINNELIVKLIESNKFVITHSVRDKKVNYQIVNNRIVDCNEDPKNRFDTSQNSNFISSYIRKVIPDIQKKTNEVFNINNPKHRMLLQKYLDYYNNIMNNYPTIRLPLEIHEMVYRDYVRPSDNTLSCSFCSKDKVKSHLDRKVALILKPLSPDAILTASIGYTYNKNFEDFKEDCVSCVDLIRQIYDSDIVNEICLDASKCQVVGILQLSDDNESFERANDLSKAYGVPIVTAYSAEPKMT